MPGNEDRLKISTCLYNTPEFSVHRMDGVYYIVDEWKTIFKFDSAEECLSYIRHGYSIYGGYEAHFKDVEAAIKK